MVVGYGKKIRKKIDALNKTKNKRYKCPSCSRMSIRRSAAGIWECKKCGTKFASGSYKFR